MSNIADLTTAVSGLTSEVTSLVAALQALPPAGSLSAADQAALDTAVTDINSATSQLQAAQAALPH